MNNHRHGFSSVLFVAGYKYKFLNKEYEDSFGLNVTETDFRQYDAAIGRFNVMDMLSELAPNQTPYRYGFNNPVFFSDPTGLFETRADAEAYKRLNNLRGAIIEFDSEADLWKIFHGDRTITQIGNVINTIYMMAGEMYLEQTYVGNGGGSDSNSNKDPGYNKYGMIFSVDGGIERPVTPSRGPRDAQWIDMNILYYWATLLYGPKTKAPYDINYERKKTNSPYKPFVKEKPLTKDQE